MDEQEDEWPAPPEDVDTGERLVAWIQQGGLEGWDRLWLGDIALDVGSAGALAALPALLRLKALNLTLEGGDAVIRPLLASPYLAGLTELDLDGTWITVSSAQAMATAPALANVTMLSLGSNELGDAGVAAVAASPVLRRVTSLG